MSEAESFELVRRDIERLREEMKEREPSVLTALRTLLADGLKWHRGDRDFPQAAALGVLFAYLRPRLILTVAGVGALVMTGIQVALLKQQNTLIGNQNSLLESQTRSTQLAVVTDVLGKLNSDDKKQTELIIAGLESYGDQALAPLLVLAKGSDAELADRALDAVVRSGRVHHGSDIDSVLNLSFRMLQDSVANGETNKKLLARGLRTFTRYSDALPVETIKGLRSEYADAIMFVDTFAAKVSEILAPYEGKRIEIAEGEDSPDGDLWLAATYYPGARTKWCKNLTVTKKSNLGQRSFAEWSAYCARAGDPIEKTLGLKGTISISVPDK